MNFYDMFDLNQNVQMVPVESGPIQGAIWNAIVSVSESALVDARFILAIIMQEVCFPSQIEAILIILFSHLVMSTFHALAMKTAVLCKVRPHFLLNGSGNAMLWLSEQISMLLQVHL